MGFWRVMSWNLGKVAVWRSSSDRRASPLVVNWVNCLHKDGRTDIWQERRRRICIHTRINNSTCWTFRVRQLQLRILYERFTSSDQHIIIYYRIVCENNRSCIIIRRCTRYWLSFSLQAAMRWLCSLLDLGRLRQTSKVKGKIYRHEIFRNTGKTITLKNF